MTLTFDPKINRAHPWLMGSKCMKFHDHRWITESVIVRKLVWRTDRLTDRLTDRVQTYSPLRFHRWGTKKIITAFGYAPDWLLFSFLFEMYCINKYGTEQMHNIVNISNNWLSISNITFTCKIQKYFSIECSYLYKMKVPIKKYGINYAKLCHYRKCKNLVTKKKVALVKLYTFG